MNSLPRYEAKASVLYQEEWSSNPAEEIPEAYVKINLIAWSLVDQKYEPEGLIVCDTRVAHREDVEYKHTILHVGWATPNDVANFIRSAMLEFNIKVSHAKMEIAA